jgi:hypothetical protein
MKKLLSAACVACFTLSLCVGCGDSTASKKATSVGATTQAGTAGTKKTEETKKEGDATPPKAP